jgi:hypothetical protein
MAEIAVNERADATVLARLNAQATLNAAIKNYGDAIRLGDERAVEACRSAVKSSIHKLVGAAQAEGRGQASELTEEQQATRDWTFDQMERMRNG